MARTQKIAIKSIILDKELYPRSNPNWQTSYRYSQSMLVGAKFPPISVALTKGKFVLLDGFHRITASKILKIPSIECEVYKNLSRKEMFEIAIQKNVAHGNALSVDDRRKIALKLRVMKYPDLAISKLIEVPQKKLENFIAQRLVNTITGDTIGESFIVKTPLKHLAGTTINEEDKQEIVEVNRKLNVGEQISLLKQLIQLLEKNLIDKKNYEVKGCLKIIKKLI